MTSIVVKPMTDQAFRVTFNRAFKSPTILQTNFFIPDWTSIISIYGNTDGFVVTDAAGNLQSPHAPPPPDSPPQSEFATKAHPHARRFPHGTH